MSHTAQTGAYALATGEAAAERLRILHGVYGPGTRRVLRDAGLRPGLRVADFGCGVGMITADIAAGVGPDGHVVGIDYSAAQIAQARTRLADAANVSFVEASATETGLPSESFDMVYSRFLLIHLAEPGRALLEMKRLLKPGGVLICEDGDLTTCGSLPPSALNLLAEFWGRLGSSRGVDYTLGSRLYHMVLEAGFAAPDITFNFPVLARGENKRLQELSFAEAGPAFVEAGFITADELQRTHAEMVRLTADESVLVVMPRMSQVWARKN